MALPGTTCPVGHDQQQLPRWGHDHSRRIFVGAVRFRVGNRTNHHAAVRKRNFLERQLPCLVHLNQAAGFAIRIVLNYLADAGFRFLARFRNTRLSIFLYSFNITPASRCLSGDLTSMLRRRNRSKSG